MNLVNRIHQYPSLTVTIPNYFPKVKADVENRKSNKHKQQLAKELSDLIVICQSVSFKDYKHTQEHC